MPSYRCYLLDYCGRIHTFIELQAGSDAVAVDRAKAFAQLAGQPFELWRGTEMIFTERSSGREPR
jgi:hypothetical protein